MTVPYLRWVIAVLLLGTAVMSYVDRQALSVLAETVQGDLRLTDGDYGLVVQAFLLFYTGTYLIAGRVVDRFGPRWALFGFLVIWSLAGAATGLATGLVSLLVFRGLLGLGEAGNYPASAKAVAEWFPPKEKAVAVGLYMMGGTLGAALAAPLCANLALAYGWRAVFFATGTAGLILAVVWAAVYRAPAAHPWLTRREQDYLDAAGVLRPAAAGPRSVAGLLRRRELWAILAARMISDPVWYFYLFWLAKYLQKEQGFSLARVGETLWVVYVAADLGCLVGGWLSSRLVRTGWPPVTARLAVMTPAAALLAGNALVPSVAGEWPSVLAAAAGAFAALLFMTNCVTLVVDLFPAANVGTAQSVIGTGGSLGALVSAGLIAWAVGHFSYAPVFVALGVLHPVAMMILWLFVPREGGRS